MIDILLVVITLICVFWGFKSKSNKITPYVLSLLTGTILAFVFYQPFSKLLYSITELDYISARVISFALLAMIGAIILYGLILLLHKYNYKKASKLFDYFNKMNFISLPILIMIIGLIILIALSSIQINMPKNDVLSYSVNQSRIVRPIKKLINTIGLDPNSISTGLLSYKEESEVITPIEFSSEFIYYDSSREASLFKLVNAARIENGRQPLAYNVELANVAREHSTDMLKRRYFSHISIDGISPFDRIKAAGINYNLAGENLAISNSVENAMTALMKSEKHKANILNPQFSKIGIGIAQNEDGALAITQIFKN